MLSWVKSTCFGLASLVPYGSYANAVSNAARGEVCLLDVPSDMSTVSSCM